MTDDFFEHPILNSPYAYPARLWELDEDGQPTNRIEENRKLMTPVPRPLTGCAGGAQEAAAMPTPILCKTVFELSPIYLRYNEYMNELKRRNVDCGEYMRNYVPTAR